MNKTVAVLQSNYIPWRGYFDIIHDVDLFVFYDEVQYTKNDWRNRNKIYSEQGVLSWLTVSCGNSIHRLIDEVKINNDTKWQKRHWDAINQAYSKAPFFSKYRNYFRDVYVEQRWEYLSELNQFLIKSISREFLNIETEFASSREFASSGQRAEKLLSLLLSIGCDTYVSGPSAKSYLNEDLFNDNGIEVVWKDYTGYPKYKQMAEKFEPSVSIIDLLINVCDDAPYYIWGWRDGK